MVQSKVQHPPIPPPTVTHCLYILYIGKGGRGSERRYSGGATVHKYHIVPLSMGATVHIWVENTNHELSECISSPQSTYFTVRGQSYFFVFQNIDPPSPCPPGESVLPLEQRRGVHTRWAERGMGGQYFGRREK
jgi:hypothetical protein